MAEPTNQEVMEAFRALQDEVKEAGGRSNIDPDKLARIEKSLDDQEAKNQELIAIQQKTVKYEEEVKELTDKLEADGKTATEAQSEAKERIDALEAKLARGIGGKGEKKNHKESPEYKAMNDFARYGENRMSDEAKALLRTDSATDGGVTTTVEMDNAITKTIEEIDNMRAISRVRTISEKSLDIVIRNDIPTATWEGEAEEGGDDTSAYNAVTVTPYRLHTNVPVTRDMLNDSAFDMESEILSDAAESFAQGEGQGFVLGNSPKAPEGFTLNATIRAGARTSSSTGTFTAADIIRMTGDIKVGYNPSYVFNRADLAEVRTFTDTSGGFLWMPGMNGPVANSINGFPYIIANSMPATAAAAYSVGFGDFRRGYTIVDRTGVSVIRDDVTRKKEAIVEFTVHKWLTGMVTLPEAITLLLIKS